MFQFLKVSVTLLFVGLCILCFQNCSKLDSNTEASLLAQDSLDETSPADTQEPGDVPGTEEPEQTPSTGELFANLPPEIEPLVNSMIFSENFDAQPDWFVTKAGRCLSGNESVCSSIPDNWNFYYTGERFHPDDLNDLSFQPSAQVSSLQHRGPSGKSYITFDESYGGKSQWGSDATLAKELEGNHKDIYAEFWFKFQPGYRWASSEEGFGVDATKIARFTSYYGGPGGSRFTFLHGGKNTPLSITQFKVETGRSGRGERTVVTNTTRCSPVETNYKCTFVGQRAEVKYNGQVGDYVPFFDYIGDGKWHKWGFRAKYNSAPGVQDGIVQAWIDNKLVLELTDIPFVGVETGVLPKGFNTFMIGGNMNNIPEPEEAMYEQWLAFDDIRVFSLK